MPVDIKKFPLLDSENTKLPLDDVTYRSRIKSFYAVGSNNTNNYIATAFRNVGDVIQAGELNEINERQVLFDTLTHQMWSNWSSYIYPPEGTPLSPPPSFGPGWAGTTPLYPGEFDANSIESTDGRINDTRPYSQVEAALLFKTVDIDDNGSGYLQASIKLLYNTGWYLINNTSFVTPKYFGAVTQNSLYDRVVSASGLKHWYYLKTPILFELNLLGEGVRGDGITPRFSVTYTPEVLYFGNWFHSAKHTFIIGHNAITDALLTQRITDMHDGAYFALDLADKSLCEHIDPDGNCEENAIRDQIDGTPSGDVSDSNPIQTTEIIDDPLFDNPVNTNNSDDGNSRRIQLKAVPRIRQGIHHAMDPLYASADITDSDQNDARSRTMNIVMGNMNLELIGPESAAGFTDKVPAYSLCVKCEHNTEGVKTAMLNLSNYITNNTQADNMTPLESFDIDQTITLRNNVFQQLKEAVKPRFINNVMVNTTIYDVDDQGQTDAENEWNGHFSELGDVVRVNRDTDTRQIEPI